MDCQKAHHIQHKRGMAKRGTSLDPEVGKCSHPLSPASHLHPKKKALSIPKNLGIPQKDFGSQKTLSSDKISKNCFKIIIIFLEKNVPTNIASKKTTIVSQKK